MHWDVLGSYLTFSCSGGLSLYINCLCRSVSDVAFVLTPQCAITSLTFELVKLAPQKIYNKYYEPIQHKFTFRNSFSKAAIKILFSFHNY